MLKNKKFSHLQNKQILLAQQILLETKPSNQVCSLLSAFMSFWESNQSMKQTEKSGIKSWSGRAI